MSHTVREQIRSMMRMQPRAEGFGATLTLDPAFSILPDHFAGQPLMPGMCMLQAVLLAAAASQGVDDLRLRTLKTAKWMQPVNPGDQVFIDGTITAGENGDLVVKARLLRHDQRCAEFSLIACTVPAATIAAAPASSSPHGALS